jgi:DNA polymerase
LFDLVPLPTGGVAGHPLDDVTLLFFDFETFYSQTYSLTKMDPASYILDPLFEAICLGAAANVGEPVLIDGPEIPSFIHRLKGHRQKTGKRIATVSHNAQFDMAIMSWRYDFHPDLIIDTMALSRTVLGPLLKSHSLESLCEYFGLPPKGSIIKEVKGMTRADIIANGLWQREVDYCLDDTAKCRSIFKQLISQLPADEIILHDMLTRCTTEPVLKVDRELLKLHLDQLELKKAQTLGMVEQMGIGKPQLMSNQKFADVLRNLGITPPTKISPHTGQPTFAFSKQDREFTDLLDHEDIMVRTVVEARLETKSTIEETRTRRFIDISHLEFPNLGSCMMPMPVIIGAAHTHRVGGGWDLNVQNMGRGSKLRDAIHADVGYVLLVADSKQIEARDTAWFCGQEDLVEQFRRGEDVYANFATEVFGYPVNRKEQPVEGFVGKTGILQLGYASGHLKFGNTVRILSRNTPNPIILTEDQSQNAVNKYRNKYRRITGTWRELDYVLSIMHSLNEYGQGPGMQMKCVTFFKNLMIGPTGLPVRFPGLFFDPTEGSYYFQDGRQLRRTYGASLLETIAQHVARCVVMGAGVRLREPMLDLGSRLVHSAHDELVFAVPERNIEQAKLYAAEEFRRAPAYAPGLPLDVDIGVGLRYGDCK